MANRQRCCGVIVLFVISSFSCASSHSGESSVGALEQLRHELIEHRLRRRKAMMELEFAAGIEPAQRAVILGQDIVSRLTAMKEAPQEDRECAVEMCRQDFILLSGCLEGVGRFGEAAVAWRELHGFYMRNSTERRAVLEECIAHAECDEAAAAFSDVKRQLAKALRRDYIGVFSVTTRGVSLNVQLEAMSKALERMRTMGLPNRCWEFDMQYAIGVIAANSKRMKIAWHQMNELAIATSREGDWALARLHSSMLGKGALSLIADRNILESRKSLDNALSMGREWFGPYSTEFYIALDYSLGLAVETADIEKLRRYGRQYYDLSMRRADTSGQILAARIQYAWVQFLGKNIEDARLLHADNSVELNASETRMRVGLASQLDFVELEAELGSYSDAIQICREEILPSLADYRPDITASRCLRVIEIQLRHDDWDGIGRLIRQASRAVNLSYGDSHRMALRCRLHAVAFALHEERLEDADESLKQIEADARNILRKDDPLHALLAENQAQLEWARGQHERALEIYEDGLVNLQSTSGEHSRQYSNMLRKANSCREELARSGVGKPMKTR